LKFQSGDKVIAYKKTFMSTFEYILTKEGKKVGLLNILPIIGNVGSYDSDNGSVNFQLDEKFKKYFTYKTLAMDESDISLYNVIDDFSNDDFMI